MKKNRGLCKTIFIFLFLFAISSCTRPVFHRYLAVTGMEQVSSERCSECHINIYNEWIASRHSTAYTDGLYKSLTRDYEIKSCMGCHSPQSVFGQKLRSRDSHLDEGVNCQSCHLRKGVLQGPVEKHLPFDIHPIMEQNRDYLGSQMCGNCHRKIYKEYMALKKPVQTCQDCHMPEIRRTIINDKPWVWLKGKYKFRRHSFNISAQGDLTEKIHINAAITGTMPVSGIVTIENIAVPHNIPAGGYGYHEVIVYVSLMDSNDSELDHFSYSMTEEMKTALRPGERRDIPFEFKGNYALAVSVEARLTRRDVSGRQFPRNVSGKVTLQLQ